ncbi:MAG: 50S ribosomal protein L11 methyltransferase [Mariprofundaceae bacterium]|nr:50S ribosomal protein L11 methyltransferase [Mariprofundaceae bacterium]
MQEFTLLQLKIPTSQTSEEDFQLLALKSQGDAIETDLDRNETYYLAWFSVDQAHQLAALKTSLEIQAALLGIAPEHVQAQPLRDDWETAWQESWHAQAIGQNFCVRPSFCEPMPDKIDLILEPGLAFGTGQHQTTRLCLSAIEKLLAQHPVSTMLDMGAGSGILAVGAAKLGVTDIEAIDMEADSVAACIDNAKANHVQFKSTKGHVPPTKTFDLVVANILANPLIEMAPSLAACVGKYLILSGLLQTQVESLVEAYQQHGLQLQEMSHEDEWVALLLTHSAS